MKWQKFNYETLMKDFISSNEKTNNLKSYLKSMDAY